MHGVIYDTAIVHTLRIYYPVASKSNLLQYNNLCCLPLVPSFVHHQSQPHSLTLSLLHTHTQNGRCGITPPPDLPKSVPPTPSFVWSRNFGTTIKIPSSMNGPIPPPITTFGRPPPPSFVLTTRPSLVAAPNCTTGLRMPPVMPWRYVPGVVPCVRSFLCYCWYGRPSVQKGGPPDLT